ncbi:hypothetical protein pb186bvf_013988 [Paramecium bursaria]
MLNKNDQYVDATAFTCDEVQVQIEYKHNISKIVLMIPLKVNNFHQLDQIVYINNYLGQEIDIKIQYIDNIVLVEQSIYIYQQFQIHKQKVQNLVKIFQNIIIQIKNLLDEIERIGDENIDQKLDDIILYYQNSQF